MRSWNSLPLLCFLLLVVLVPPGSSRAGEADAPDLMELDLEALMDIEVVSVSKRAQSVKDVAAAVFVITGEDALRSGATTVADALAMAPGMEVRKIDSNKWAISSRGLNGRYTNKLLVLVDGRSVYTTLFSGVYWEQVDLMLEDVDRIEVIRGPGAAVWGANAVNGVVNIITKHAADSQGTVLTALAGDREEFTGSARYGWKLGENTYARLWQKSSLRGGGDLLDGGSAHDDWKMNSAGFRIDSELSARDQLTVQGDLNKGRFGQTIDSYDYVAPYAIRTVEDADFFGANLRADWRRTLSPTSEISFQTYLDHWHRVEYIADDRRDVIDLELRHRFQAGSHLLSWGAGYRHTRDEATTPVGRVTEYLWRENLLSAFLQDDVDLSDRLCLSLGMKFEDNSITGEEFQPGGRLLWRAAARHRVWASVARAVRTPSHFERDIELPVVTMPPYSPVNPGPLPVSLVIRGDEGFDSEKLTAYELGYRYGGEDVSLDLTVFFNDYTDYRSTVITHQEVHPQNIDQIMMLGNYNAARAYGAEASFVWTPTSRLRFDLAYSYLEIDEEMGDQVRGASIPMPPRHKVSLRGSHKLTDDLDFDAWLRSYSEFESLALVASTGFWELDPSLTVDLRLGWRPADRWRIDVAGLGLLEGERIDYVQETFTAVTLVKPSWYVKATLEY